MIKHKWLFDASDELTSFEIGQSATRVYPEMISHFFKKENESSVKERIPLKTNLLFKYILGWNQ